jgi:ADP-heptose:LPS heptosyltransferase
VADGTVLVRRSSLGDVVLLGAVTSRVPAPVTVVTDTPWVHVAAALRGVDRVIEWPRGVSSRDLASRLPAGHLVDLHGDVRTAALAVARGGQWSRIRKRSVRRRLWLHGLAGGRPSVVSLYADACGVKPASEPWILADGERDVLTLLPGAAWRTKRYAERRLAKVAEGWAGPVAVACGPGEEDIARSVASALPGAEILVEVGFTQTIELLGRTRVAVGSDSGLLHLAAACGARVVGLFGPTHPDDGFFGHPGEVVQRELSCRPCALHGRRTCPLSHHRCMDISVDVVRAAVERQWAVS